MVAQVPGLPDGIWIESSPVDGRFRARMTDGELTQEFDLAFLLVAGGVALW
jgi:hypothetical protein